MTRLSEALLAPRLRLTVILLLVGAAGGGLAMFTLLPMPFLLGSLAASAAYAAWRKADFGTGYAFPHRLRMGFVAVIGALIGARVDPQFFARAAEMWISLAAVTLFVVLGHWYNYQVFRRLAGFDRVTAFFCGTPGGLIESIELGEAAGGDVRLLTLQHYLRIILVIVLLPAGLSLLHGAPLGSAGGMRLSSDASGDLSGLPLLALVCAAGLLAAKLFRLPAGSLLGALLVSALGSAFGLWQLHSPEWVVMVAQVVVGVSLGARFIGITARMIRRSIGFALVSILGMLAIGAALAAITAPLVGEEFQVLLISMAPGGAIEMGLVALSLSVNPAFVTFHHLYRIGIAVLDVTFVSRWMGFSMHPAEARDG